jgi:hypothetical protein
MMQRDDALTLLKEYVTSESLINHCCATAAVMKKTAGYLGEDEKTWETIGILHDIDFEKVGEDMTRHGVEAESILALHHIDPTLITVIREHNHLLHEGAYETPVEIALQASDSISGLIIACALVKGGKISEVTPKTVKKKMKDKGFAAGCERDRIRLIEPLIPLPEFYALAIEGIKDIRDELGLI